MDSSQVAKQLQSARDLYSKTLTETEIRSRQMDEMRESVITAVDKSEDNADIMKILDSANSEEAEALGAKVVEDYQAQISNIDIKLQEISQKLNI